MFDFNLPQIINEYLVSQDDVFTAEEFFHYVKSKGGKVSREELLDVLHSSDLVFSLVNKQFITRAGVFEGRWFSFKPSKEEVEKGQILIGHRCMPFVNPEVPPDSIKIVANNQIIASEKTKFTMNFAMDTFALFGEGYVIPYVINDKGNESIPLTSIQYSLPTEIQLTSWPIEKIAGGQSFEFGDRILCRVISWKDCTVEMYVQKSEIKDFVVSDAAIQRELWYTAFEEGLLKSFDKNGPGSSIEEQLALLYLENQEQLCIKNCGSAEEFLKHTTKIGFSSFGVETRIWKNGEAVPYVGKWNQAFSNDLVMSDMSMTFSPQVIDAYLENYIYEKKNGKTKECLEELMARVFPSDLHLSISEQKMLLLNIEKRHDILEQNYNQFNDYTIAPIRRRILSLFSQVNSLICAIGCSKVKVDNFPQQELVVLTQLFSHIVRLLEEVENVLIRDQFPVNDVALSLDGMEDTFEDIAGTLKSSLEVNKYKGFELLQ